MLKENIYTKTHLNIINEDDKGIQFARRNKVKYDPTTNTVDCLNQMVRFNNNDFVDGTFDFKLINLSDDCSYMFIGCFSLKQLSNMFTIPSNSNYVEIFYKTKFENKEQQYLYISL